MRVARASPVLEGVSRERRELRVRQPKLRPAHLRPRNHSMGASSYSRLSDTADRMGCCERSRLVFVDEVRAEEERIVAADIAWDLRG